MSLENAKKAIEATLNECLTVGEVKARLEALSGHIKTIEGQVSEQEEKQAQMHAQAQPEQFEEMPRPKQ